MIALSAGFSVSQADMASAINPHARRLQDQDERLAVSLDGIGLEAYPSGMPLLVKAQAAVVQEGGDKRCLRISATS